jgi:hypothetical protein
MLVQYEENTPPQLVSTWSWQDTRGSSVLIALAWIGLLVGAAGALYWAHLSVLGAIYGTLDWPGYVWLALTAAGAGLIAPVLWPFLETRRPQISRFVLVVGVISWLVTSASGAVYLIGKSRYHPEATPTRTIETELAKDTRSVYEAQNDCRNGIWRGCEWLNSRDAHDAQVRIKHNDAELWRRKSLPPPKPQRVTAMDMAMLLRDRMLLLATVMVGGAIALAMLWGSAEAMKGMYSEPGSMTPRMGTGLEGLPVGSLGNPVDVAFESWANQCIEAARGERVSLAVLHAHYLAWCVRRRLPTYQSDSAFGRALNRQPDPGNPGDIGGPIVRHGAYSYKTGGRSEYIGIRLVPDDILDEIEAT